MANYTILIVDYDPRSVDKLSGLLTGIGHRVEVAKDGLAAIESFEQHCPDMVILEAMIPKKHGFEVCQEIKARPDGEDVPVIIMTAVYRGRKYRTQAFHMYHCDEYLEKPVSDERLIGTVKELLHDKTPRTDGAASVAPAAEPTGTALEDIVPDATLVVTTPTPVTPVPATPEPAGEPVVAAPEPGLGESLAEITEDDILSRLDEIMPDDDDKAAKTAGG